MGFFWAPAVLQDSKLSSSERVRFTYVLMERQSEFVRAIVDSGQQADSVGEEDAALRVAILWRQKENRIKLEWMQNK